MQEFRQAMDYESKSRHLYIVLEPQHTWKKFPDDLFMMLLAGLLLISFFFSNKWHGTGVGISIDTDSPGYAPLMGGPGF